MFDRALQICRTLNATYRSSVTLTPELLQAETLTALGLRLFFNGSAGSIAIEDAIDTEEGLLQSLQDSMRAYEDEAKGTVRTRSTAVKPLIAVLRGLVGKYTLVPPLTANEFPAAVQRLFTSTKVAPVQLAGSTAHVERGLFAARDMEKGELVAEMAIPVAERTVKAKGTRLRFDADQGFNFAVKRGNTYLYDGTWDMLNSQQGDATARALLSGSQCGSAAPCYLKPRWYYMNNTDGSFPVANVRLKSRQDPLLVYFVTSRPVPKGAELRWNYNQPVRESDRRARAQNRRAHAKK